MALYSQLCSMMAPEGKYYIRVDAHAILRYMKRTPDYKPNDKETFAKEAMNVVTDLAFPVPVNANYISPSGLWPLATKEVIDGFLHVKTFIHKSMLNRRQTEIYRLGLRGVTKEGIPIYKESLREFGIIAP